MKSFFRSVLKSAAVICVAALAGGYHRTHQSWTLEHTAIYVAILAIAYSVLWAYFVEKSNLHALSRAMFNLVPNSMEIVITHDDVDTVGKAA